jgi:hypothetical protein
MVKITNGVNVFEVSNGAFEGIYSKQGYRKVTSPVVAAPVISTELEKTKDELFLEGIVEKPLSQWNKDEVKRFAELNEIDITGTKNAGEAKELIKGFLDQSNV